MGTDTSDPIGGQRPPPPPPAKKKTISGPYQSYQVVVSVSTLTELQTMQPPGVDGAPTFFRDNGLPWFWFRNLPAGYTPSTDGHTGATASTKAGFYVSLFALTAAAGLNAFLTVARASASRMLDVPASTLYLVKDGARTYVQSFVAGWHWKANFPAATSTDNETTCRPTAWAALGLDGAFVRDVQGDFTARNQTDWFCDTAAPDNEGTGSALDPLKSDTEIGRRWGSGQTRLSVAVTIRYINSPTAPSNFDVLLLVGASIRWLGAMATPVTTDVLTAVTVQNRATQTQWDITAPSFGATAVKKFARIVQSATPGNVGAYATVLKDLTGGKVRTTSFGLATVFTPGFVVVTPAVGDTIEIIEPAITLQPGRIAIEVGSTTNPTASPLADARISHELARLEADGEGPGLRTLARLDRVATAEAARRLDRRFPARLHPPNFEPQRGELFAVLAQVLFRDVA